MTREELISLMMKVAVPLLTVLIGAGAGAYLGAYFAYKKEREQKKDDERLRQIGDAQKALFILGAQLNALVHYREQVLEPVRDSPTRWLDLKAQAIGSHLDLKQDSFWLSFLMGTDDGEIPFTIHIADKQFRTVIAVVQQHTQFTVDVFQPAMNEAVKAGVITVHKDGIISGDVGEIERALGRLIAGTAKTNVAQIFSHIDSAIEMIDAENSKLREVLRRRFPGVKFSAVARLEDNKN